MSAREELLNELALWFFTTGHGSREFADRILNKHAHELAEKIRSQPEQCYGIDGYFDIYEAKNDAADLIDPEVN